MTDISGWPIMPQKCASCPFRDNKDGEPIGDIQLRNKVQTRCLTEGSQICHHPNLRSKPSTHLCRGARDFQLQIFYRLGVIDALTDEAWQKAMENPEKQQN